MRRQREQQFANGALVIAHADVLGHVPDGPADRVLALVGSEDAGQDLQQRALAHAVAADQPDVLAGRDPEGDVGEQQVPARMCISEPRHRHVRHVPMFGSLRVVSLSGLRMTSSDGDPPAVDGDGDHARDRRPISISTPGAPLTVMSEPLNRSP